MEGMKCIVDDYACHLYFAKDESLFLGAFTSANPSKHILIKRRIRNEGLTPDRLCVCMNARSQQEAFDDTIVSIEVKAPS
jgi:hypothetical protein